MSLELTDALSRLLSRVGGNSRFWKTTERNYAVNEGICLWQALSGRWHGTFLTLASPNSQFQNVPKQIVSVTRVRYNGVLLELTSFHELDNLRSTPPWEDLPAGTPTRWLPVGMSKIALVPKPDLAGTIEYTGYTKAPKVHGAGPLDLSGDEELRLLNYGHHYLTIKEGTSELQATVGAIQEFLGSATEANMRSTAVALAQKYAGLPKDEAAVPLRAGEPGVGIR